MTGVEYRMALFVLRCPQQTKQRLLQYLRAQKIVAAVDHENRRSHSRSEVKQIDFRRIFTVDQPAADKDGGFESGSNARMMGPLESLTERRANLSFCMSGRAAR